MKKIFITFLFLNISLLLLGQNFTVQSSEVFKRSKGESVPDLIGVDETGFYLTSFTTKRKYMSSDLGDNMYSLIKYNLNYEELYDYAYDKELNNSEVAKIIFVKNKIFLFSFTFDKKQDLLKIYGTTINKQTGKFESSLQEIISIKSEFNKQARMTPDISLLSDSSGFVISTYYRDGKEDMSQITIADFSFNKISKVSYKMSAGDNIYSPIDFMITNDKGMLLLEMDYKIDWGIKKNNSEPNLNLFSLKKFSGDGKMIFFNKINLNNKYLLKASIKNTGNNQVLLAGLFCNSRKLEEINGVVLNRYDASTGNLISSSEFLFPTALNNTEAMKKVFGKVKASDGMLNNLRTPMIISNPITKSTLISTEFFSFLISSFSTGSAGSNDYSSNFTFLNGPLLFVEADQNFNLNKVTSLPKNQVQKTVLSGYFTESTLHGADGVSAGFAGQSLDWYSSAAILFSNDKMFVLINDNPGNSLVTKTGDNAKIIDNLSNSTTFVLIYDFATGSILRKQLFNNSGLPIPLLKNATLLGNNIHIFARLPHMLAKSEYRFIKVTIK